MTQQFDSRYLPRRNENLGPQKDLYVNVHYSICLIAPRWKPLKCPSAGEWRNKMCYIHTMEYDSAKKKKRGIYYIYTDIHNSMMKLKIIVLSE